MIVSERDFSTFKPGDNPYELGSAAVRILAGYTGIELGASPSVDEINRLSESWRPEGSFEQDLRAAVESTQNPEQFRRRIAGTINDSGILNLIPPRNVVGDRGVSFERLIIPGGQRNETLMVARLGQDLLNSSGKTLPRIEAPEIVLVGNGSKLIGSTETAADFLHNEIGPQFREQGLRVIELYDSDPDVEFRQLVCGDLAGRLAAGNTLLLQFAPASHTFGELLGVVPDDQLFFVSKSRDIGAHLVEHGNSNYYPFIHNAAASLARWVKAVHSVNTTS